MRHPKRAALALAVAAAAATTLGFAHSAALGVTGQWITNGTGNWSGTANWNGGTVPNAVDDVADFTTIDLTVAATAALDVPVTLGALTFGDTNTTTSGSWTIQGPSGLTLAVTTGVPTITVNDLGSSGSVVIGTGTLLSGNQGLTKAGIGTLILNQASSPLSGGTTISGGTLQVGSGGTTGFLGTGNIVNNGTLIINHSDAYTINDSISGTGNLTKNAAGILTFNSSANSYTGATTINGGAINFVSGGSVTGLAANSITVAAGGSIGYGASVTDVNFTNKINGAASTGALAITSTDAAQSFDFTTGQFAPLANMSLGVLTGNNVVYTGTVTPAGNTYRFGGGGGTLQINSTLTGATNNAVFGPATNNGGTVILTAANTYNGTTTITAGSTVQLGLNNGNSGTLGSGAVNNNGTLTIARTDNTTIGNTIIGTGTINKFNNTFSGASITTFTGSINAATFNIQRNGGTGTTTAQVVFDNPASTFSFTGIMTVPGAKTTGGDLGGSGRLTLNSGTLNAATVRNDNNDGAFIGIAGGTANIGDLTLARTGGTTTPTFTAGFHVSGASTIANIGTIELGNTTSNSWGAASFENGTTNVSGIFTVGQTTNGARGGAFQLTNGTLNVTEPTFGLVLGREILQTITASSGNTQVGQGTLSGGTANISKVTFGYSNFVTGGAGSLGITTATATLYMGAGGMVKNSTAGQTAAVTLTNGTIGANANWAADANVPFTVSGTTSTFKAADASGNPFNITLNGNLAGTGTITKTGGGSLDLQGSNAWTGTGSFAVVNAGTLSGKASSLTKGAGSTIVNNASVAFNDLSGSSVFNGVVSGSGSVLKTGAGTSLLNAGQTYTGSTTVNNGALGIKGNFTNSSGFTVNNGGGLMTRSGGATVTNLTFGSAPSDAQTIFTNDGTGGGVSTLTVNGTLTTNGTTTVDVGATGLTTGTKVLIDYNGSIAGSGFGGFTLGTLPLRMIANLVNNVGNTSVDLNISGFDLPRWNGNVSGTWDINTTPNWKTVTGNTTTTYLQNTAPGDQVLFDDNAAGTTTVQIPGTVQPAIVTIANNNLPYTFTGAGKISGVTPLIKNGTGQITISNTGGNDYTGGTTINAGTLTLGVPNALPAAGSIVVAGGTLDINGQSPVYTGVVSLQGGTIANGTITKNGGSYDIQSGKIDSTAVLAGTAGLSKNGTGTAILLGISHTYTGQTVINAGTLQVGDGVNNGDIPTFFGNIINSGNIDFNPGGPQLFTGTITGLGGTITKDGPNDLYLSGANEGNAIVNGGNLILVSSAATGASVAPRVGRGGVLTINNTATVLCQGVSALGLNSANLPPDFMLNPGGTLKADAGADLSVYNGTFAGGILTADPSYVAFALRGDYGVAASTTSVISVPGVVGTSNNVTFTMGSNAQITVAANLSGTTATSFTGPGTAFLTGDNSGQTGTSGFINVSGGAVVVVTASNNLGGAPNFSMNGGTVRTDASLGTDPHNVSLNGNSTINTNGFDSTFAGIVQGSGGLTKAGAGLMVLSSAPTYTGPTVVSGGTERLDVGNLTTSSSVTVSNSAVLSLPSDTSKLRMIRTGAVAATTGGQINIDDNKMIVTGVGATGSFAGTGYTGVQGLVASGRAGTNWNGTGIVTAQAAAQHSNFTAIGVALASDVRPSTATATALWSGQTITGTDTLVMYTYGGDATLDGKINVDDYIKIDSGIAAGLTGWVNGDFNYDGKVNIDDYTQFIDANIGTQGPQFPTAGGAALGGGGASGVSAVPEPATFSILALTAMGMLRRQRRRNHDHALGRQMH